MLSHRRENILSPLKPNFSHPLLISSLGISPLLSLPPFDFAVSDYAPPRTSLSFIHPLFSVTIFSLHDCTSLPLFLPPHSPLPSLALWSPFDQYLIHSPVSLSLPPLPRSLSDIQTQEPDRISLVPLDLVVLLLSLPEEDRD